ncbi:hypothetical protein [Dokdonella soli]|uniref:Uncharacterized protein n=1 Tax=Dokdonella soli TaxID=529810 RepID=A0ABN1IBC5_9GAMM
MIHLRLVLTIALTAVAQHASAANPLHLISETYSEWKERLFGAGHAAPAVVDAPANGPIAMQSGHPQRLRIDAEAPERDFPKGKSRYRVVEFPEELAHAAVRIQVIARRNEKGHGNAVFKPLFYVFTDGDGVRDPVEAKPLHLDIRPFRRTRLLGCVTLDKVQRLAVATSPEAVGKPYESDVRDAVKAPTPGGYYYTTDAVKVKLPYADSGELILEVTAETAAGKGC